ncbi:hypothetical protein [Bradyrhizobium sp. SRS-191]|uniref:hypothetical protein n=1 Tax=Bradyrhizobium sp. SRS-191 TaxID=2962606 RepID=UPI00211E8CEA|nr:hypothetical protein [Bradyrhizobium sp. SRS-191]
MDGVFLLRSGSDPDAVRAQAVTMTARTPRSGGAGHEPPRLVTAAQGATGAESQAGSTPSPASVSRLAIVTV